MAGPVLIASELFIKAVLMAPSSHVQESSFHKCLSMESAKRVSGGEEKVITDRGLCKEPTRARPLNQHLVICPPPHTHTHTHTHTHGVPSSQRQCVALLSVPVVSAELWKMESRWIFDIERSLSG
ncbi:unnamed protein product [Leuciscus chuanchicus]